MTEQQTPEEEEVRAWVRLLFAGDPEDNAHGFLTHKTTETD